MPLEPYVGEPHVGRLIGQIRGQPVDGVPNLEAVIEDKHVEAVLGRYAGSTLAGEGDPAKGPGASAARPMDGRDFVEFNKAIGQDIVKVQALWTPFRKRTLGRAKCRSHSVFSSARRERNECASCVRCPISKIQSGPC